MERKEKSISFIRSGIEQVIKTCGKRSPGSVGEKRALEYMAEELRKYSDLVTIEEFRLHPKAFTGWIPLTLTLVLAAFAVVFFVPSLAIALIALAGLPALIQFVLFKEVMDPLYSEKVSSNVIAVKNSKEKRRRRIILTANADAANEVTLSRTFGGTVAVIAVIISFVGLLYLLGAAIAGVAMYGIGVKAASGVLMKVYFGAFAFLPFWLVMYRFINRKYVIDGANDNLSGCFLAMSVLNTLEEEYIDLENTEIWVLLTGGKEAGLRGAKAFCKEHSEALGDCETIIISLKSFEDKESLNIPLNDMNGLIRNDSDVCRLLKKAGNEVDIELPSKTPVLFSTDSTAFREAKLKSACLMGSKFKALYRNRKDSYDNLNKECLGTAYDIIMAAVRIYDSEGLANLPENDKQLFG